LTRSSDLRGVHKQFCDLDCVQRCSLTEVVGDAEHLDTSFVKPIRSDPPNEASISPRRFERGRILAGLGIVDHLNARGSFEDRTSLGNVNNFVELGMDDNSVPDHHRNPNAGGRDREIWKAQDLA
jgi:hypothetical protein